MALRRAAGMENCESGAIGEDMEDDLGDSSAPIRKGDKEKKSATIVDKVRAAMQTSGHLQPAEDGGSSSIIDMLARSADRRKLASEEKFF